MRGRYYWNKRTPQDILKGLEYFQQAVTIDPDYSLAYVAIAESYNLCVSYQIMTPEEAAPKAKRAAQEALQLDPDLGDMRPALLLSSRGSVSSELLTDRAERMNDDRANGGAVPIDLAGNGITCAPWGGGAGPNNGMEPPRILSLSASKVEGRTRPNATVDVYKVSGTGIERGRYSCEWI